MGPWAGCTARWAGCSLTKDSESLSSLIETIHVLIPIEAGREETHFLVDGMNISRILEI
ncbi:hypothetical protein MAMT_00099 [Methylacidimicrobium tartarophylax]|uniref:Uncharacterized protein n=1 Tax=Methylacidimicrobium tartarophylax TaxID=1041768 RepID=A0A5E6MEH8_9BACT|nr:hypothetical protein MAMT_00099 [Methylacidimicrobium tartarophylax]